jgi:hypothetical protein
MAVRLSDAHVKSPELNASTSDRLVRLFLEAGFSVDEPIQSDPQGRRYLVVFQSAKLFVKFSDDGTDLFVWVSIKRTGEAATWHDIRTISQILADEYKFEYDLVALLSRVEGIAQFVVREHDRIVRLMSSATTVEFASRVRQVEGKERIDALRAIGADYKPPKRLDRH